ncbi:hypothetical protein TNCV_2328221 [Trichonephila clavipes]|nr:hypothetical protein TNCV_2328221 [Trichonephila clavipes]
MRGVAQKTTPAPISNHWVASSPTDGDTGPPYACHPPPRIYGFGLGGEEQIRRRGRTERVQFGEVDDPSHGFEQKKAL